MFIVRKAIARGNVGQLKYLSTELSIRGHTQMSEFFNKDPRVQIVDPRADSHLIRSDTLSEHCFDIKICSYVTIKSILISLISHRSSSMMLTILSPLRMIFFDVRSIKFQLYFSSKIVTYIKHNTSICKTKCSIIICQLKIITFLNMSTIPKPHIFQ